MDNSIEYFFTTNISPIRSQQNNFFIFSFNRDQITLKEHFNERCTVFTVKLGPLTLDIDGHDMRQEFNQAFLVKLKKVLTYTQQHQSRIYIKQKRVISPVTISTNTSPTSIDTNENDQTLDLLIQKKFITKFDINNRIYPIKDMDQYANIFTDLSDVAQRLKESYKTFSEVV